MADDTSVSIGAQIGGLTQGLREATSGVNAFASSVQSAANTAIAPFQKFQEILLGIAAIAAGGAVFGDIIKSTLEVASESNKLAKSFGETLTQASQLRAELKILGIGTDDYRQAAMMLDRQVRANETTLRANGLVTRDANGALLNQRQLLENGVAWLRQYKEGTDRNIAAQAAFGRGAGDTVMQLLKMTTVTRAAAIAAAQDLGLITTPADIANARQYKQAMGELALTFEAIKKAIGEAVLPYLTAFAGWFRAQGPGLVANMKGIMASVIDYAFQLVAGLGNFALDILAIIVKVGAGVDNVKTRAAMAGAGAIAGGAVGSIVPGVGTVAGAAVGGVAGWIAGGMEETNDAAAAQLKRLEEIRADFKAKLEAFQKLMQAGPGAVSGAVPGAGGDKSAAGLVDPGGQAKAAAKAIDGELAVLRQGFEQKRLLIDADVQQFRMREDEKFGIVQRETEAEYQAELNLLKRKAAIAGLDKSAKQDALNQISLLEAKHRTDMVRLDLQSVAARQATYMRLGESIQSAWDNQLRGLITGTTTWAQAFKNILLDLGLEFIKWGEKLVVQWIANKLAMATADQTGAAAQVAAAEAARLAMLPGKVAGFTSDLTAQSALVFAGIFASLAPIMGPAAAGPAAGGQATVLAQLANVPKYEQGAWRIPTVQTAVLHPNERVLNARDAAISRGEVAGRSLGGGSKGDTFNLSFIDAAGAAAFIAANAGPMAKAVSNYQKRNRSTRGTW